jgi:cytochrome c oxidase subunit 3
MNNDNTIDVSPLPTYAFGHRSLMWWGTMGLIAVEGTVFALTIVAYFYLRTRNGGWPPGVSPPAMFWGSVNTIVLLLSLVPNHLAKAAAERLDLGKVQLWLVVGLLFGGLFNWFRVYEFGSLNVWWDTNAYGSIVWTLLGLHTTHIVTDVADTIVLTLLMFTGPIDARRMVDVSENAIYWDFVVAAWIPIYGVIYLAPRIW